MGGIQGLYSGYIGFRVSVVTVAQPLVIVFILTRGDTAALTTRGTMAVHMVGCQNAVPF